MNAAGIIAMLLASLFLLCIFAALGVMIVSKFVDLSLYRKYRRDSIRMRLSSKSSAMQGDTRRKMWTRYCKCFFCMSGITRFDATGRLGNEPPVFITERIIWGNFHRGPSV